MDCMEAIALKSSLRREINASFSISTHQIFYDDLWSGAGINGVSGEDFSVDDLLDFSNGEFQEDVSVEEDEEEEKYSLSTSSQEQADDDNNSNTSNFSGSGSGDSDSLLTDELAVPVDLAELEWVSHFVDDSISELSLLYPAGKLEKPEKSHENYRSESESEPKAAVLKTLPSFPLSVPRKARSKRPRTSSSRSWSLGSQLTESPSSSSSSSSGFSSTLCSEFFGEPAQKKQKKKPFSVGGGSNDSFGQFQRRCSHCHVQKTPQWRTGPLGAKTLCNACGVRYKSGRLFPEYRPACSPTFSGDIHSNSHRKVLEMRRTKETDGPEAGLVQMVQSF